MPYTAIDARLRLRVFLALVGHSSLGGGHYDYRGRTLDVTRTRDGVTLTLEGHSFGPVRPGDDPAALRALRDVDEVADLYDNAAAPITTNITPTP